MKKDLVFSSIILDWFDQHGRKNLPWQKNINPYRVWLSEIMLQQTQVKTVIPYFERFVERFPCVEQLANATEDDVLTLWSGLGYYARARNLHKTAKVIQQKFNAQFPLDLIALQELPGIGRSTAGAILAIAGGQKATILDGNVKRVLTRFHAIATWPGDAKTQQKLWEIAEQHTPTRRVADYTQAMMDLGATVCGKSPDCAVCPLKTECLAYQTNSTALYPARKPKKQLSCRKTVMIILQQGDEVLLKKRPSVGIWGGLWSFPEYDVSLLELKKSNSLFASSSPALLSRGEGSQFAEKVSQEFGCKIKDFMLLPLFRHSFSHFHLDITPLVVSVKQRHVFVMESNQYMWYNLNDVAPAVPAPVKKILVEQQRLLYTSRK